MDTVLVLSEEQVAMCLSDCGSECSEVTDCPGDMADDDCCSDS